MSTSTPGSVHGDESELLQRQLAELTDAYVQSNDQLLALYRLSEWSAASLDPLVAARRAVEGATDVLNAGRTMFISASADKGPRPLISAGQDSVPTDSSGLPLGLAIRTDGDEPFLAHDRTIGRSVLAVPVKTDENRLGTLLVLSRVQQPFSTADLKLAGAICNQLAVMLELSDLHNEALQRTIMEHDHDTASVLAQAAMNRPIPQVDGYDLAAYNRPARSAGGDFFAAARSNDGLFLALGDVSGKGLPAALIMNSAVSATYAAFERHPGDVAGALIDIDRQLAGYLSETGMFITLAIAYLDPTAKSIHISNAGQWPVLLKRGGQLTGCTADGPPIGVFEADSHGCTVWDFGGDDLLFVGSDGWTDQSNPQDEMFGEERLAELLTTASSRSAKGMIDVLVESVDAFGAGAEQVDDLTALVARHSTRSTS